MGKGKKLNPADISRVLQWVTNQRSGEMIEHPTSGYCRDFLVVRDVITPDELNDLCTMFNVYVLNKGISETIQNHNGRLVYYSNLHDLITNHGNDQ